MSLRGLVEGGSLFARSNRKEFSRATKRAAWERCGGRCEGWILDDPNHFHGSGFVCCAPIDVGSFHYDHIDNVWTSQDNSLENCQVLCVPCHKEKTKRDVKQIAKSKRIQDKRIKALTSKRPMAFGRNSSLKRKMNGTIVERRTGRLVSRP